jgi:hypothetical protein
LQNKSNYGNPTAHNDGSPSSNVPTQWSNDCKVNDIPQKNTSSDESDVSRARRISDCVQKVRVGQDTTDYTFILIDQLGKSSAFTMLRSFLTMTFNG